MITDADIKKMKVVFATKEDLKSFATKDDLKSFATKVDLKALDSKMDRGFIEIIKFIGETRDDIVNLLSKQLEELRDITRRHQMTLEKHDSRITHLEYISK